MGLADLSLLSFYRDHQEAKERRMTDQHRQPRGAIGKAFLVYLGTGSVFVAAIAYFLFSGSGC